MYRVYAVDSDKLLPNGSGIYHEPVLIHDDAVPGFDLKLYDPKLTIQQSSSGSFIFSCTKDNPGYDYIKRLSTTIIVENDSGELWRGRVIQEEEDFYFNRKFTCEGELGYLNDTLQPPHAYSKKITPKELLTALLDIHNSKVGEDRQIYAGYVSAKLAFKDEIEIVGGNDQPTSNVSDKYIKYSGLYISSATYYSYYLMPAGTIQQDYPSSEPYVKTWYKIDNQRKEQRPRQPKGNEYIPFEPNAPAGWVSGITDLTYEDPPIYILNPNYVDETQPSDNFNSKDYLYTNYETTMSCISSMLIDKLGGYVVTRRDASRCLLDYFADDEYDNFRQVPQNLGGKYQYFQRVRFGENLLDFVKNWDMTNFVTVLLPLGAEISHPDDWPGDDEHPRGLSEYTTVESINSIYVQASGKYVQGTSYYRKVNGYKKANVSEFVPGQTDVSNLYTYETVIVPMGINYYGIYDSQVTYYYYDGPEDGQGNPTWILKPVPKEYMEKTPSLIDDDFVMNETFLGREWFTGRPWRSGVTMIGSSTPIADPYYPSLNHLYTLNPNYPNTTTQYKKCPNGSKYDSSKTYYETYPYYEAVNTTGWTEGQTDVSMFYVKEKGSSPYVIAQTPMETYGWIERSITWDDLSDPQDLYNKAVKYLADYQFDKLSFVVTATDLYLLGVPYALEFKLLDKVLVESPIHGINRYFPITKITIPLDSPESTEYTFGKVIDDTLTGNIS